MKSNLFNYRHMSNEILFLFHRNLHFCLLGCEGEPGFINGLDKEVPFTGWIGFDGAAVTVGGLSLAILGVMLLYLSATGLWLWFPFLR